MDDSHAVAHPRFLISHGGELPRCEFDRTRSTAAFYLNAQQPAAFRHFQVPAEPFILNRANFPFLAFIVRYYQLHCRLLDLRPRLWVLRGPAAAMLRRAWVSFARIESRRCRSSNVGYYLVQILPRPLLAREEGAGDIPGQPLTILGMKKVRSSTGTRWQLLAAASAMIAGRSLSGLTSCR